MVIDTIDGRRRNVYSACLINDVPNVHWKPGLCLAISLTNSMAISSQLFDMCPHSPGNDGNVSNVISNLVYSRPLYNVISKGITICVAGNGRRKNIACKNKVKDLERMICLSAPHQWDGQGETNIFRESMGQLRKGFYPDAIGRESCFLQLCGKRRSILIS